MLRKQHVQVSPSLKQQIEHKLWWPGHKELTTTSLYVSFRPRKRWLNVRGEHTLITLFLFTKQYILIVKKEKQQQIKSNLKLQHQIEPLRTPSTFISRLLWSHIHILTRRRLWHTWYFITHITLFNLTAFEQLSMSINIHPQNFKWLESNSMYRWTILI